MYHRRYLLIAALCCGLLAACSPAPSNNAQAQPPNAQPTALSTPTRPTVQPSVQPSSAPAPSPSSPALSASSPALSASSPAPSAASPAPSPQSLAPIQPLRNTEIIDRPLRNLRPLTDGSVKYKLAVWSPASAWIAATPQDGPGLDAINSATGDVIRVLSDTFVLEPVWDAAPQPCLLLHRSAGTQDQLSRACLPQIDAAQPSIIDDAPLSAPALVGDNVVYSQGDRLLRQRLSTPDAAPELIAESGALVTALSIAGENGPLLAWTPLATDLETVQTLVTPLDQPAPYALSQPGEGLWLPRWAPDGRALALTSIGGRLVSTTLSGDQRYDLGPGDLPAWSPDGARIAYGGANAGDEFISRDIHLVDWQGAGPRLRLTNANELQLFVSPSWSPDGGRIACVEIDSGQIMIGEVP